MIIKELVYDKAKVTTVSEDTTLQEAIDLLERTDYRCVPILDDSQKIFRGNIYKMHIYRHMSRGGDMTLPVTHLLKNATKFIHTTTSFFNVFFIIKDLPYITVLDEQNYFYGILTHSTLLNVLEQSWNLEAGSYILTISTKDQKGSLTSISKIINRYCSILSCITLDIPIQQVSNKNKCLVVTLESGLHEKTLHHIVKNLARKGHHVLQIENLQK